ncbi:MAG: MHYT domain-containing protein, partial [Xanthobacteraceae bacterium]
LTAIGFAVAMAPDVWANAWLGGVIVGAGIAAMHYTGMAAYEVQGQIFWDPTLVAASILLGAIFGGAALPVGLHHGRMYWRLIGALLMTLAICSHHFTAMGAAALLPDPTVAVPDTALPSGLLAIAVALATLIIVALALAGAAIEIPSTRMIRLRPSCAPYWAWDADYASRCWPKVLKPMRSLCSCNASCAMRRKVISLADPRRSTASGT